MFRPIKKIAFFCKLIFYAHNGQLDVIRLDNCPPPYKTIKKCYFFSLVLYIIAVLYGIFGLECESRPSCQIDLAALPTSPYHFYHQMFPKAVWSQMNILSLTLFVLTVGCYVAFLVNPPIEERFLITSNWAKGKKKNEFEQMCTFRKKFVKLAFTMEAIILPCTNAFAFLNVLFINAVYNVNLTSAVFWLVLNPLQLSFMVKFVYMVPCYVILASKYIAIQQKTLSNQLIEVNAKLRKMRSRNLASNRVYYQWIWMEYISVNTQLTVLCKYLREYARFWSPYLTCLFVSFITIQCYAFYIVLFVNELPLTMRSLLVFVVLGIVIDEFVLIDQCAAVVKNFKRILHQNRTFYQLYRSRQGVGPILSRNLAKAETLQDCRLLHSYAFRLFGNYRITNKSFHIIISYISLFFLYLAKNRH